MALESDSSALVMDRSVVRHTQALASNVDIGAGVQVQLVCEQTASGVVCDPNTRSYATVQRSIIELNHQVGLLIARSNVVIEATVVRDTFPNAATQRLGRGVVVQHPCRAGTNGVICDPVPGSNQVSIIGSLIARNRDVGLMVMSSTATVDRTVIRDTYGRMSDELFGDGVSVVAADGAESALNITGSLIRDNVRAGLSSFGARLTLERSAVQCSAVDMNGEFSDGRDPLFEDGGSNVCGCPNADRACKSVSTSLSPPDALPSN